MKAIRSSGSPTLGEHTSVYAALLSSCCDTEIYWTGASCHLWLMTAETVTQAGCGKPGDSHWDPVSWYNMLTMQSLALWARACIINANKGVKCNECQRDSIAEVKCLTSAKRTRLYGHSKE